MEKRLLTVEETADYLGVKTSTVYAWVNRRYIPFFKIGRLVKFDLNVINGWLENKQVGEYDAQ